MNACTARSMLCVLGSASLRELDADGTPVVRVAPADDEALLLEAVEVPRERGALDVERARELVLRPPLVALQVREDEPRRHRPSDLGEGVVEGAPDVFRRMGELEADGRAGGWHARMVTVLVAC